MGIREENMKVTVEDICNFPEFSNLKLVAGKGGLNNPVDRCGILDYEFVDGVREKWSNTNFRDENMIVMTSFLYAKDNEYRILDAVKKLASRKCSGLIIKNIFHLPLHENVLRYADTMNFPILTFESSDIHFEDLIILISERIKHYDSLYYRDGKVDEVLRSRQDHEALERLAYEINPTFKTDMMAMYFEPVGEFLPEDYIKLENRVMEADVLTASDSMFCYKSGFFIVRSRDMFSTIDAQKLAEPVLNAVGEALKDFRVGVSSVHHLIQQIKNCFEESLYAAKLRTEDSGVIYYEKLGIYKVVLPFCGSEVMKNFSREYMKPLEDYDLETRGCLLETAVNYVLCGGDVQKTAETMIQHKNTIRYRLKNISNILGLNVFETQNYEILSFAVRIFICNGWNL